jgi:phage shock protein PspC (stress-responsive transcriptional regulator)
MKKTLAINLSGLVFNLDEDAYQVLKNYLDSISEHFRNDVGKEEIITDIENRFAEEFNQKRTGSKQVIILADVNEIIKTLGSTEDFPSEKTEQAETAHEENTTTPPKGAARRLYRDTDNAMLGGVASGIANYFGTDTVWIRISFVVFTFAWGFAIPLYILLWIITPKAETASQRAEMKGEPLTIKAIEEHVKNMVHEGKEKFNSLEKKMKNKS